MMKLFRAVFLMLLSISALAQGKIGFQSDSLRLACWIGGDLNGQAINSVV